MTKNESPNIADLLTAEFWAELFAQGRRSTISPIQNFGFNILKSKLLHLTAENLGSIWQTMFEKMQGEKLAEAGLALYYVYTEQALVSAVSASEVYFKDTLAYAIQNNKRLLNHYAYKEIKVKRILEIDMDLSENIGMLIVEKMNFQNLDNVQNEYKKLFGFEPLDNEELNELKKIFAIRHAIVHKSGIVDHLFISKTGLDYKVGNRLFFKRDEILQMIEFIEKIVTKIDSVLDKKLSLGELTT
jgi:hypothetical protein